MISHRSFILFIFSRVTVVHKALEINEKSVEDPQKEPCVATKRLTAKAECEPECDVLAPQSTAPQSVKSEPYRPPVLPSGKLCQMVVASVGDDGIIYGMTKNAGMLNTDSVFQKVFKIFSKDIPCFFLTLFFCSKLHLFAFLLYCSLEY